jgi:hypothetical protein
MSKSKNHARKISPIEATRRISRDISEHWQPTEIATQDRDHGGPMMSDRTTPSATMLDMDARDALVDAAVKDSGLDRNVGTGFDARLRRQLAMIDWEIKYRDGDADDGPREELIIPIAETSTIGDTYITLHLAGASIRLPFARVKDIDVVRRARLIVSIPMKR